jgi:hypothetical protein
MSSGRSQASKEMRLVGQITVRVSPRRKMDAGFVTVCTQLSHAQTRIQSFVKTCKVPVVERVSMKSVETEREGGYGHEADEVHDHRANKNNQYLIYF